MQIATSRAIAEFNMRYEATVQLKNPKESKMNNKQNENSLKIAKKRDKKSILRSEIRSTEKSRYLRKAEKLKKSQIEKAKRKKEGPTYGPGIAN